MNSQASTEEQLKQLKALWADRPYEEVTSPRDDKDMIRMANFFGLYDAADVLRNRLAAWEMERFLEWGDPR